MKKAFYFFLDVSGILLGMFLCIIGWRLWHHESISLFVGFIIFLCGIAAMLIHGSHYFNVKSLRWLWGNDNSDYFVTRKKENKI